MTAQPHKHKRERDPALSLEKLYVSSVEVFNRLAEASHLLARSKDPAEFRSVAQNAIMWLMQHCIIAAQSNKNPSTYSLFALRELELYVWHKELHPDRYPHRDEQQFVAGTWYFHKTGGSYRGGSFKGVDITFGAPDIPCAALVRALQRIEIEDGQILWTDDFVEGPSRSVDVLLRATNFDHIKDLVGDDGCLAVSEAAAACKCSVSVNPMRKFLRLLCVSNFMTVDVVRSPRVGLIPRSLPDLDFAGLPYRFIALDAPHRWTVQRGGIVAALFLEGRHPDEIMRLTGATSDTVTFVMKGIEECAQNQQALLNADVKKPNVIGAIAGTCASRRNEQ